MSKYAEKVKVVQYDRGVDGPITGGIYTIDDDIRLTYESYLQTEYPEDNFVISVDWLYIHSSSNLAIVGMTQDGATGAFRDAIIHIEQALKEKKKASKNERALCHIVFVLKYSGSRSVLPDRRSGGIGRRCINGDMVFFAGQMTLLPYILLSVIAVTPPPISHIQPVQYNRLPTLQYYITEDYVIAISHPLINPDVWEYVNDKWVSRTDDGAISVTEYKGKVYSHHFRIEIISQRDLLMRIINGWGTEYNYYDLAMLSYKWNGDGRFTLKAAADLISEAWLCQN